MLHIRDSTKKEIQKIGNYILFFHFFLCLAHLISRLASYYSFYFYLFYNLNNNSITRYAFILSLNLLSALIIGFFTEQRHVSNMIIYFPDGLDERSVK